MAPSNSKLIAELMNNSTTINTEAIPNGSGVSIGSVIPFGGSSAPTGFLACDGATIDRTTYADLFSAIGTTWGAGDGVTTFRIPDLRGRFIRGSNPTTGVSQSESTRALNFRTNSSSEGITFRFGDSHPVWWGGEPGQRTVIGHPMDDDNTTTTHLSSARAQRNQSPNATSAQVLTMRTNSYGQGTEIRPINYSTLYIIKY
jgi:hypothetical protein